MEDYRIARLERDVRILKYELAMLFSRLDRTELADEPSSLATKEDLLEMEARLRIGFMAGVIAIASVQLATIAIIICSS